MTISREDLNPCTVQLTITCEPSEVKEGFSRATKQLSKKIRLPGFRPGHAPRAMVEQYIDKEDLYGQAADEILKPAINKAIEQEKLAPDPSQRIAVDLKKLDQETGEMEFVAKVPLPPVVDLGEYKGLPVEMQETDVTDDEIEYQLEELRKRRSTREAITDRGTQEGDVAVVNIKIDGKEGDGRTFMTVVGQTFPQLDKALIGMKVEEMKHIDLAFPENFQEKDWAGKKHKATVSVNSLSAVTLPELDEDFAKSLKTENIDDLRARMKDTIGHAKQEMVREIVNAQLLDTLLERSTVHVPDNMWEGLAARRLQETALEQQKAGKTMEQYAEENGMTVEDLAEKWNESAQVHVKRALLIREVFTREKMQLSNAELSEELVSMAQEYEMSPEDLLTLLRKNNQVEELHFRAIARKVGEFLAEHADAKTPVTA